MLFLKTLIVIMYNKVKVIFVKVSNNMTILFTINFHACMKRTHITTIVMILGIYLRLRWLGKKTAQIVKNNSVLFIIIVILELAYFS